MDPEYQRYSDIRGGCVDVIGVSTSRTMVLYCDEESQGECVKQFVRTRIPDSPSSASRDRLEARFHLEPTNICTEE